MKVTSTTLLFVVFIAMFLTGFSVQAQTATVMTDKADYHPGDTVEISGTGWQPGETITIALEEIPKPALCKGHTMSLVADAAGNVYSKQFLIRQSHLGVFFNLNATGTASGLTAYTYFTDATITSISSGGWHKASTWAPTQKTGTITSSTSSALVSGNSTSFTTELAIGSILRRPPGINGPILGIVASIIDDTNLMLTTNAGTVRSDEIYSAHVVPKSGDAIVIGVNNVVIVEESVDCLSLLLASPTTGNFQATRLVINSGQTFTVGSGSGLVTIGNNAPPGSGAFHNISINVDGTLLSGEINQRPSARSSGSGRTDTHLNISSTGIVTVNGNVTGNNVIGTQVGTASVRFTGGGKLNLTGLFQTAGFDFSTGTVNYNNYGAQSVRPATYHNLSINGSGIKKFAGVTTINGSLSISSNTVVDLDRSPHTTNTLMLGGAGTFSGTWGSTSSNPLATHTNDTYFAASTGRVTVTSGACVPPLAPIPGTNIFSYDGELKIATASVLPDEIIDWYAAASGTVKSTLPTGTNAGTTSAYAETRNINSGCVSTKRSLVTLTINKVSLAINATGINKVYDGNVTATVNLSDKRVAGDVFNTNYTSASFEDKIVGTGKPVNVSGINITGPDAANYTFNTSASAEAGIISRVLAINAIGIDKVYDGKVTATVTLGDDRVSGDAFNTDYTAASFEDKNVGAGKPVTVSGVIITGVDAANYTFNTSAFTNAGIISRILAISAKGTDKIYDGKVTATVTLGDDRVLGDAFNTDYTTASFEDKNVGTGKPVKVNGIDLAGADAVNYTFNTSASAEADIISRVLAINALGTDKVYDGKSTTTVNLSDDRVSGDAFNTDYTAASFEDKNVGAGKPVTVSGIIITGVDAVNYFLSPLVTTKASISPLPLNGDFTASNKLYDGNNKATAGSRTLDAVISRDEVSLIGGTATFGDKAVAVNKTVMLTGASLTGADAGNYTLESIKPAFADISALPISGSFSARDKTYDGNLSASIASRSLEGTIGADDVSLDGGTATFDNKNIGITKVVTLTGATVSGTDGGNYVLTGVATTSNDISSLAIYGTFTADDKIYDGKTSASVTNRSLVGNVATDDVSLDGGTATFDNKDIGTAKVVKLTGTTLSGTDAGNYTLTSVPATIANITPKALVIAFSAENKEYDGNSTAITSAIIESGLVYGDVVTIATTNGTFEDKNIGTAKTVTANVSKSGADANNYSANPTATTTSNITARKITITAEGSSKTYGNADPLPLTYQISSGSLVSGESFTGTLNRVAGENIGNYAIQQGSVALTNNYALTYVPAKLTITPRLVTIAAAPKFKLCSQADPELTYSIVSGSLVNSDTFSGSLIRNPGESSDQGYMINQGSIDLNTNYTITYNSAVLIINGVSVDANASSNPQAILTPITLKATVSPQAAGITVNFFIDNQLKGKSVTNPDGLAVFAIGSLPSNVYEVKAVVGTGCSESVVFLPVYDPNGGFVTGGGWILSPRNAYVGNLEAEGKANFGFVAKYKKGSTVPEGNTEFQFQAGSLSFNSSAYDDMRLVIAGAKANYKGTGKINGGGNYGFMLSAIDGQVNGGGNTDKFRIKIWDKNNGNAVVYDNDMGKDENDLPTTALGGGSIVIHEVKGGKQSSTTPLGISGGLDMKVVESVFEQRIKLSAYPNPFGKQSTIAFTLPTDEQMVTLDVYDLKGSKVKRMYEGKAGANQTLEFEFNGFSLSSGVYMLRLTTPKKVENFKIIMTE